LHSCPFISHDTSTTDFYTLSLHDALPIFMRISIPRTTDPKCSPDSQAVVGWCSTPVMPSIWWRDTLLDDRSYSRSISLSAGRPRSEEHTSELQSRENLVCRLLLEKKKQK